MIRAAVLGKPIDHSLSPLVHALIYDALEVDFSYEKIELDENSAEAFLLGALHEGSWSGFSLTMPLKEVGFRLGLPVAPEAVKSRSINTVTPDGCFNTDISGLIRIFSRIFQEESRVERITILGSGATARSTLIALEDLLESYDASSQPRLTILRRTTARDAELKSATWLDLELLKIEEAKASDLAGSDLLISTLPSGAESNFVDLLTGYRGILFDISYSPWPSIFAQVSQGQVISGLTLLVAQAIDQAAIFSGIDFNKDEMYEEVLSSTMRKLSL